jgi:selenoprotein W-related protein
VPQAVSLAQAIMDAFSEKFSALKLIPGEGGCFEVTLNGELIYSKLKTGDFPADKQILETLKSKM